MKKLLSVLNACVLVLSLVACSAPAVSLSAAPSAAPAPSRTPAPHPTFKVPYPTASSYIPNTEIPDVDFSGETAASSSGYFCEDEENIYCGFTDLYCINKATGEATMIDTCYSNLALLDGKVWYAAYGSSDTWYDGTVLRWYNVKTGAKQDVLNANGYIEGITAYKGKLYYLLESGLYSMNSDGTGNAIVQEDVYEFSIYQNKIYYRATGPEGYYEATALYRCGLDGSSGKKMMDEVYPGFTICGGWLFSPYSDVMLDLATGDTRLMTEFNSCVPLGQYLIYSSIYGPMMYLFAYDTGTGETYSLMRLNISSLGPYASQSSAYCLQDTYDGYNVQQVSIRNGSATMQQVGFIDYAYWEYEEEGDDWDDYDDYDPDAVTPLPLSSDTVIIADSYGTVIGGYSDGKWLTHTQAGAYCLNPVTFYGCTLLGCTEPVQSSIAVYEESDWYSGTWSVDGGYDDYGFYSIFNLDGSDGESPLENEYFFTAGPERVPATELLSDTSAVLSVIQGLIDANLGAGTAVAEIQQAVRADIDGDGQKEIVVNASNSKEYIYDPEARNLYSIACIIESDGSVHIIEEDYEKDCVSEDFSNAEFVYVQNIIDIDGDGRCEIILEGEAWEAWWTNVYKYDGDTFTKVLDYSGGC